jgi:predicted nucleotidyltransferase component of viral defense system
MSGLFFLFFKAIYKRVKTKDLLDLNNLQRSSSMQFFLLKLSTNSNNYPFNQTVTILITFAKHLPNLRHSLSGLSVLLITF